MAAWLATMVVGAQAQARVEEGLWAEVLEVKKGGRDVWRGGPCTVPRIVAADCGATG